MNFKFLSGDVNWREHGGSFVSRELECDDFTYRFVISVNNLHNDAPEAESKYLVSLSAVSVSEALERLPDCFEGMDAAEIEALPDLVKVDALHSYGYLAPLFEDYSNNLRSSMQYVKAMANVVQDNFDEFMCAPVNKIGSTGYDAIKGDLLAGLNRSH